MRNCQEERGLTRKVMVEWEQQLKLLGLYRDFVKSLRMPCSKWWIQENPLLLSIYQYGNIFFLLSFEEENAILTRWKIMADNFFSL